MTTTKGVKNCPVCRGDGYFFAAKKQGGPKTQWMYCDCAKNIEEYAGLTPICECGIYAPEAAGKVCGLCMGIICGASSRSRGAKR